MSETETVPLSHRATSNRADPYSEPNSCLSDFSDSLNSLNSLNSMKVLLHLEKTPLSRLKLVQGKESNTQILLKFSRSFLSVSLVVLDIFSLRE